MGLSSFPLSPGEGLMQMVVVNTAMSFVLINNMVKSLISLMGFPVEDEDHSSSSSSATSAAAVAVSTNLDDDHSMSHVITCRTKAMSISRYGSLSCKKKRNINGRAGGSSSSSSCSCFVLKECCVCLCKFEDQEEISRLSCNHFFHRNCLDKWFANHHLTCPLCRSVV